MLGFDFDLADFDWNPSSFIHDLDHDGYHCLAAGNSTQAFSSRICCQPCLPPCEFIFSFAPRRTCFLSLRTFDGLTNTRPTQKIPKKKKIKKKSTKSKPKTPVSLSQLFAIFCDPHTLYIPFPFPFFSGCFDFPIAFSSLWGLLRPAVITIEMDPTWNFSFDLSRHR